MPRAPTALWAGVHPREPTHPISTCAPACAESQHCPPPPHTSQGEGHPPISTAAPTHVPGSLSHVCPGHIQVGPCVSTRSPIQGHSHGKCAQLSCKPTSLHSQPSCQHSALPTQPQASCTASPCASTALCKHTSVLPCTQSLCKHTSLHSHSPHAHPALTHTCPSRTPCSCAIPLCCTPPCTLPRRTPWCRTHPRVRGQGL